MGQSLTQAFRCCKPVRPLFGRPPVTRTGLPSDSANGKGCRAADQPKWVEDESQSACYNCGCEFDLLVRRHHCRRCRNIYCDDCSSHVDRLLMYGDNKLVRLCEPCAVEAAAENSFMEQHVPLLIEGSTMARVMLMARTTVYLRVTDDLSALVEREPGRSGAALSRLLPLEELEGVSPAFERDSAAVFVIHRGVGKGQLKVEASSEQERDAWVSALRAAMAMSHRPRLVEKVEGERQRRREAEEEQQRERVRAQQRQDHNARRVQMAIKYQLDPLKYQYHRKGARAGAGGQAGATLGSRDDKVGEGGMGGTRRGSGWSGGVTGGGDPVVGSFGMDGIGLRHRRGMAVVAGVGNGGGLAW